MLPGQLLQGRERVADQPYPRILQGGGVVADRRHGPFFEGFAYETVAVEIGAPQGKEDRTRLDAPGVGRNVRMRTVEVVQFRYACLHCGISLRR